MEQRRILIVTHVLTGAAQLGIAWLIVAEALTYNSLLVLVLLGGVVATFSGPPRDAMLSRVAGDRIQRAVFLVIGLQFGAQIVGYVLASFTDRLGAALMLTLAALMFALGAIPCRHLPASAPSPGSAGNPLREIAAGLALAIRSQRVRPALILTFALGVFFVGTYMVLLPLIVRDVYHGAAADLSLAFGANLTGTLVAIGFLMRGRGVQRQGRAFMLGLLFGSVMLSLLYLHPPYWAFFVLSFVWGLGGGLTMTMGRAIVQESAPPELAARMLSIYAFAMSAGMPIGSLAIGYAAQAWGTLNAALLPSIGMALCVLLVHVTSKCWYLGLWTNAAELGVAAAET
jgi:MFS family permease